MRNTPERKRSGVFNEVSFLKCLKINMVAGVATRASDLHRDADHISRLRTCGVAEGAGIAVDHA